MRRLGVLIATTLLLWASVSFGQEKKPKRGEEPTRSVQGVVMSTTDQPVSGAVVQLKNTKTLQIRSFITKAGGAYYFHELSPDIDYELNATYNGASSGTKTLSSFDSRKTAIINLKLNPKK